VASRIMKGAAGGSGSVRFSLRPASRAAILSLSR
jgi:hypothetical protein